jgi:hypothetical protein
MSVNEAEPLHFLPMERWGELETAFEADWPRGISAATALKTQRQLEAGGLGYGFKVYCPYGDVSNGMVAFNKKVSILLFILCICDNYYIQSYFFYFFT